MRRALPSVLKTLGAYTSRQPDFPLGKNAYEPPRRLVLAWQINAQWQYDEAFSTEVKVRFTSEGPKRTRVELEHCDLERFGDAQEAVRQAFESPGSWTGVLAAFKKAANEG